MSTSLIKHQKTNSSRPWILIGISCLLILLPFFFTSFTPSTDLPQHMSQIRLLRSALKGESDLYLVQWFAPNNLIYVLLTGTWFLFSPFLSGKITLILIVLLWVSAIFLLAYKFHRPFENAVLASTLIFNLSLYWGFLNFLIGWPFFALWFIQSQKPINKKGWFLLALLSVLLYASHAIWLLLGSLWLLAYTLLRLKGWKSALYRLSSLAPIGIAALIWYPQLSSARGLRFDVVAYWITSPLQRLHPSDIVNSMFGGVKGYLEPIIALAILVWIILSIFSNRRNLKGKTDSQLLICAAIFIAIMLFAPEKYLNTIYFSQRWFPFGIILLLLALPRPKLNKRIVLIVSVALLLIFSIRTTQLWYLFEQKELSGLQSSLDEIPEDQRILGLDYVKTSSFIKGRPFLQIYAYAQALKGADLNFSFAEHSSGIVAYKEPRNVPWTLGLDWNAEKVKYRDLQYFDYVLINGSNEVHSSFSAIPSLKPVTLNERWCLYKVVQQAPVD